MYTFGDCVFSLNGNNLCGHIMCVHTHTHGFLIDSIVSSLVCKEKVELEGLLGTQIDCKHSFCLL